MTGLGTPPSATFEPLLSPRAIAVVGASGREGSLFSKPLAYLRQFGYAGRLYPVNPNYHEINGLTSYPSLAALPGPIDLVLCLLPAARVTDVILDAGKAGARAAVVYGSDFSESGPEGIARQDALSAAAGRVGIRVLGPNCQGFFDQASGVVATFTPAVGGGLRPSSGLAYVGQSGAVGGSLLDLAQHRHLGFSVWASTGNQADIAAAELGTALLRRADVDVLLLYLESVGDGRHLLSTISVAQELGKHLILITTGRSDAGRKAIASHTGALLPTGIYAELLADYRRVITVDDIHDALDVASELARGCVAADGNVGIVTTSGGAGSIAADLLVEAGVKVSPLAESTQAELAEVVPTFGAVANPVDVTAQLFNDNERGIGDVVATVASDPSVVHVLVLLTLVIGDAAARVARDLALVASKIDVPLSVVWMVSEDSAREGWATLRTAGVPLYPSTRAAALAISAAQRGQRGRELPSPSAQLRSPSSELLTGSVMLEAEARDLLAALGIATPAQRFVTRRDQLVGAFDELGTPIIAKAHAPWLIHKTEHGGVRKVDDEETLAAAFDDLMAITESGRPVEGVLLQSCAVEGVELLLSVVAGESDLPPIVTVAAGGILAELHQDVASAFGPVDHETARCLLHRLAVWPVLEGYRGRPAYDTEALVDAVSSVAAFACNDDRIGELEINPIRVLPAGNGVLALDFYLRTR